jgi:hypothetical protein
MHIEIDRVTGQIIVHLHADVPVITPDLKGLRKRSQAHLHPLGAKVLTVDYDTYQSDLVTRHHHMLVMLVAIDDGHVDCGHKHP